MASTDTLSFSPDLAGPQFSTAALAYFTGFLTYQAGSKVPGVYYDGDFTAAAATGQPVPEHPFARNGDPNAAIVSVRYMQDAAYYKPQQLGLPLASDNRLLLIDEKNFKDEGARIITWDRVYATVPSPRDEWASFSYPYQYIDLSGGASNIQLAAEAFTVTSRIRYEYFLVNKMGQYPPYLAPKAIQIGKLITKRGKGDLRLEDGILVVSNDAEIIAEDSEIGCWNYPIHYRKTRFITGPTLEFWGDNVVLPGLSS